jgi:hypothetical protein
LSAVAFSRAEMASAKVGGTDGGLDSPPHYLAKSLSHHDHGSSLASGEENILY